MKLGVMTVLLGDLSLDETLKYLKSLGVQEVEIGCGGTPGTCLLYTSPSPRDCS